MAEDGIFHGPFVVSVIHVASPREQRLVVRGSDTSDDFYRAVLGLSIAVSGETWRLDLEWDAFEVGFTFSLVKQSVAFDVDAGLVYTLRALNGLPTAPIPPFDDLNRDRRLHGPGPEPHAPACPSAGLFAPGGQRAGATRTRAMDCRKRSVLVASERGRDERRAGSALDGTARPAFLRSFTTLEWRDGASLVPPELMRTRLSLETITPPRARPLRRVSYSCPLPGS